LPTKTVIAVVERQRLKRYGIINRGVMATSFEKFGRKKGRSDALGTSSVTFQSVYSPQ
jgi:hypothetical protein